MSNRVLTNLTGYSLRSIIVVLILLSHLVPAFAEEQTYSGDFLSRSTLTGDWGGVRNDLAKKGVTLDLNVTQTEQGVINGGKRSSWEYGGRGDLTLKLDTGKMGLWPGGFLTAELEGNFGHSVNLSSGALMPMNSNQIFPVVGTDELCLSALNFAQFLSEYFGLVVGKVDIMSGDANDFAHGRNGKGDTQFMNLALNINPTLLMVVPYTPLVASMIILPTKDPKAAIVNFSVMSNAGGANTTGFTTMNKNKLTFAGEGRVRTDFFGMTGHQLVGAVYSNKEYADLDQRLVFDVGTNQIQKTKSSWAVYYNFDQYMYEPEKGSGRGMGIFGRFGASDGNPNPLHYFMSLGFGGKGMAAGRPHDRFGIGYYYLWIGNPKLTVVTDTKELLRDEQGFEAFYTVALTPWLLVTPDVQVIKPGKRKNLDNEQRTIDTATVLGLRMQVVF